MKEQNNPEKDSLIPEVLRRAMAAGNDPHTSDRLFPISAKVKKERQAAGKRDQEAKNLRALSPEIGDLMPDGTVYAGLFLGTNQPMYVTAQDAPLRLTFDEALAYAQTLSKQTSKNFHLPSELELYTIYKNRIAIGGFDMRQGVFPTAWYWADSYYSPSSRGAINFNSGVHDDVNTVRRISVRCVRS